MVRQKVTTVTLCCLLTLCYSTFSYIMYLQRHIGQTDRVLNFYLSLLLYYMKLYTHATINKFTYFP